jgi:hypothetical protein
VSPVPRSSVKLPDSHSGAQTKAAPRALQKPVVAAGGTDASNTDPYATAPTADNN